MNLNKCAAYGRDLLRKRHRIILYRSLYRRWWFSVGDRANDICQAMNYLWEKMTPPEKILIQRSENDDMHNL